MLLGGDAGQRLEPMGEMGSSFFDGPVLHGVGDDAGCVRIQFLTQLHGPFQRPVRLFGQAFLHHSVVKNHASEIFGNVTDTGRRDIHAHRKDPHFLIHIDRKGAARDRNTIYPLRRLCRDELIIRAGFVFVKDFCKKKFKTCKIGAVF